MERGKLTQALDCLQHAHKLAPEEDYIVRHLKIVQQRLLNLKQAPGMQKQKSIAFAKYDPSDFGGGSSSSSSSNSGNNIDDIDNMANDNSVSTNGVENFHSSRNYEDNFAKTNGLSSQNQKHSDKSTIATERNSIKSADTADVSVSQTKTTTTTTTTPVTPNKQKQYRQSATSAVGRGGVTEENALPIFVHDLDDPSSGTS